MKRILVLNFLIIIFCFSCGDNKKRFEVKINENGYSPSDLVVEANSKVKWINNDNKTHTVSSGVEELWDFDSGEIKSGEEFEIKFIEEMTGPYIYYCKIHGNMEMEGTIIVQPEGSLKNN